MDTVDHYDKRFGVTAVEKGFVTEMQIIEALGIQVAEDLSVGKHRVIGKILVEQGLMTLLQVEEVLEAMGKDPL